jgi:hypothetical protein
MRLSTKAVDKSVEKPGSLALSARSVSYPNQIGGKVREIQMIAMNSTGYTTLCISSGGAVEKFSMDVTRIVRKSLILRISQSLARDCRVVNRRCGDAFIQ